MLGGRFFLKREMREAMVCYQAAPEWRSVVEHSIGRWCGGKTSIGMTGLSPRFVHCYTDDGVGWPGWWELNIGMDWWQPVRETFYKNLPNGHFDAVVVMFASQGVGAYLSHWMYCDIYLIPTLLPSVEPFLWYGSHTDEAYSTWGRTNPKYAFSLMSGERIWRFLLRNPRDLFALVITCDTWVFHVMSLDSVKPRYLALLTASSWWSWRVYLWISGFGDLVKFITWHLPGWNSISHLPSQASSFCRSLCSCNWSFFTLMWL